MEGHEYPELRDALEKLRLNDASFFYEPETSTALGFGFRCGFLGLLHMDIVQERLEREFDQDLVTTAPGVLYRVTTTDGEVHEIDSPAKLPETGRIAKFEEPVIKAMILTPAEHVGGILQLCQDKRGVQKSLEYLASDRVLITYELPFAEVVLDFYDRLKTISRGYASLDYHISGYWESPLQKLDILVNGDPVDALSVIVHRDSAYVRGRALASKMRELIPRQMFEVAIQASDRQPHHRPRVGEGPAQERARQVLRRRHHAQAQAAREAEGRQEADEARRQGGDPAGGLPRRPQDRNGGVAVPFRKSVVREYFESIVIAVVLALFIRTFVVQAFKIPTGSMEPNLLIGDHLLVNKFVFAPTVSSAERALLPMPDIRRGDIVVFKYPEDPERDFIKRVIGLPGETVELPGPPDPHQRPADRRAVRPLPAAARGRRAGRSHVRRRARQLRARGGAGRLGVRHGRQPGQLAGLAVLGVPADRDTSRGGP